MPIPIPHEILALAALFGGLRDDLTRCRRGVERFIFPTTTKANEFHDDLWLDHGLSGEFETSYCVRVNLSERSAA